MSATILVIDDDRDMRETMRRIIESAGYQFLGADNGASGLKLFRDHDPDLVITDIYMPNKDGLETVREIRTLDPAARILAVSGGGSVGGLHYLAAAEIFGAVTSLQKPLRKQDLIDAIKRALADGPPAN